MADDAIQCIKMLNEIEPDRPFFVYYVPGGTHSPHHPTPEWIDKFNEASSTRAGTRCATDLRQPEAARRDPAKRPTDAVARRSCPSGRRSRPRQKKLFVRQAEVYAAYLAYTDYEIGRVCRR